MVSSDSGDVATGGQQPSPYTTSRKRTADEDVTGESTAAKKAAISARGQLTMRRSGTLASFHGPMRPSVAAGQSSPFPQAASSSRPGPGPGPLSLLTPAKFDIPAGQSSTARSQVLSPVSSSTSSFSSVPSSIANFRLSTEVRQSLSRSAPEAPESKLRLPSVSSSSGGAPQTIPQFGPAHRMPPESDDEESQDSDADAQAIEHISGQPGTFEYRLLEAQKQSEVWNYIKNKLAVNIFTCSNDSEQEAMLQILQLPKQNDLDDKPMRERDRKQRRYNVIIGSILQVVGTKGHCDACGPHCLKYWEHRKGTCIGLPPEAIGPKYQELVDFVASRCSNCIRWGYQSKSCHFALGDAPPDRRVETEVSDTSSDSVDSDLPLQNRARARDATEPQHASQPPVLDSRSQGRAGTVQEENGASGRAEALIRDVIVIGFCASTELQQVERQNFHSWLATLFSFSSSSPGLEDQALAALRRLRQLDPDAQADIRRRLLQMLPGAIGRPA